MDPRLARAGRGATLRYREPGEAAVGVDVEVRAKCVEPGRLQPLPAPVGQVTARGLLQCGEQVVERGVVESVGTKVIAQPGQEVLQADIGHQLFEHAGALGVGDAVEVHLDGGQVGNVSGDRMRRGQLVLPVGPGLFGIGEGGPGLGEFGRFALAQHRGEGGERLVEPQVIPPPHGDQVAEPHVCHLVQHRLGAPLIGCPGDLAAKDVVLQERHRAGVLHRPRVELGHEQLVILAERVRDAKVLVVEAKTLLGLSEQPLGVHELRQRGAAEDA